MECGIVAMKAFHQYINTYAGALANFWRNFAMCSFQLTWEHSVRLILFNEKIYMLLRQFTLHRRGLSPELSKETYSQHFYWFVFPNFVHWQFEKHQIKNSSAWSRAPFFPRQPSRAFLYSLWFLFAFIVQMLSRRMTNNAREPIVLITS